MPISLPGTAQQMHTLLQLCVEAVAQALPLDPAPTPSSLPDEGLTMRVYEAYMRLDQARRRRSAAYSPARHLEALRQFARLWQPSVLLLAAPSAPGQPGTALCAELAAVGASLAHLELSSPTAMWLAGLGPGLDRLTCLSLGSCPNLSTGAVQQLLQQLAQLTSLDLCGVAAVTDALAPTLASLFNLAVLRLNHTSCSDATVEWLTYGSRLHQWSTTVGQQHTAECSQALQGPAPSTSNQTQQWPRTKIRSWHLAYTRVTPQVVGLLSSVDNIVFLDLRGSGVRAGQLAPLRARHALSASFQGAVLSRTAAMVLASVTLEQFVCANAAQHGAAVAAVRAGPAAAAAGQGGASQQWVNQGVNALLQAAAASAAQQA